MEVLVELIRSIGPILAGVAAWRGVKKLRKENTEQHDSNHDLLVTTITLLRAHTDQDAENFRDIRKEQAATRKEIASLRAVVDKDAE